MRRIIGPFVLALGIAAALLVSGTASAEQPHAAERRALPSSVAIAIGQLKEDDGGSTTIDLRAGIRDGKVGGTLRFFCPMEGYYNGGVRTLTVEDGAIKATGGGGLIRPDGTRIAVRYTADISADGEQVTIAVEGRNGYTYTMSGQLEHGLVWAGDPRNHPAAQGR